MRFILRFVLAFTLVAGLAFGQTGELSIIHGAPGHTNAVDVVVNGVPMFTGFDYGDEVSADLAPGIYAIEFVDTSGVLLSTVANVWSNERTTVAAHLAFGGFPIVSVFTDDDSSVSTYGSGRVRIRHLANAGLLAVLSTTSPGTSFNFMSPLMESTFEEPAGAYAFAALAIDLSVTPVTVIFNGPMTAPIPLAADDDLTINIVGTPNTTNFGYIIQTKSLTPATPPALTTPDLAISGTLIGSTIDVGGILNYTLTGAAPNGPIATFISADNTPQMISPGVMFGIGGVDGMFPIGYCVADPFGTASGVYFLSGFPVSLEGTIATAYVQAVSVDFLGAGLSQILPSDIETFPIGL